jgi:hypothetical protein
MNLLQVLNLVTTLYMGMSTLQGAIVFSWTHVALLVMGYVVAVILFGPDSRIGALLRGRVSVTAPLPPGPKGIPLLGNVLDMPKQNAWDTYSEWRKVCINWGFNSIGDSIYGVLF